MFLPSPSSHTARRYLARSGFVLIAIGRIVAQNANRDMDRSIKPGDDFYRYANGGWLKTAAIPAGQSSYDTRAIVERRKRASAYAISFKKRPRPAPPRGSVAQKVGRLLRQLHGRRRH